MRKAMNDDGEVIRCFMDGIDWQHHLGSDVKGTSLYPTKSALLNGKPCVRSGECGFVEVEVRLVRWVESQRFE